MEHTLQQIDWIINYLKGKEVSKRDLKTFFEIQNEERQVIVNQLQNGLIEATDITEYKLSDCIFTVKMTKSVKKDTTYIIDEVSCKTLI